MEEENEAGNERRYRGFQGSVTGNHRPQDNEIPLASSCPSPTGVLPKLCFFSWLTLLSMYFYLLGETWLNARPTCPVANIQSVISHFLQAVQITL